jgi:hypothetical protein
MNLTNNGSGCPVLDFIKVQDTYSNEEANSEEILRQVRTCLVALTDCPCGSSHEKAHRFLNTIRNHHGPDDWYQSFFWNRQLPSKALLRSLLSYAPGLELNQFIDGHSIVTVALAHKIERGESADADYLIDLLNNKGIRYSNLSQDLKHLLQNSNISLDPYQELVNKYS